jgi:hypothetical protein
MSRNGWRRVVPPNNGTIPDGASPWSWSGTPTRRAHSAPDTWRSSSLTGPGPTWAPAASPPWYNYETKQWNITVLQDDWTTYPSTCTPAQHFFTGTSWGNLYGRHRRRPLPSGWRRSAWPLKRMEWNTRTSVTCSASWRRGSPSLNKGQRRSARPPLRPNPAQTDCGDHRQIGAEVVRLPRQTGPGVRNVRVGTEKGIIHSDSAGLPYRARGDR